MVENKLQEQDKVLNEESLNEVPENWEERTPGTKQAANIVKESMIANLQAIIKEIEESDSDKLHSLAVIYDYEKEEKGLYETALRQVGESVATMNLALVYLKAVGHKLIENQPEGDMSKREFERGLGVTLVKTLVDAYNLKDDDLDLNELKKDYDEVISVEDVDDVEVEKEIEDNDKELFPEIEDKTTNVDPDDFSEDSMFSKLD